MVFETIVANLLNKYLSQFVDELTAKQLNLFAWSGTMSLDNIAIKANAFDSLSLPFRVVHGHIGRIEASIPWKSLYSSPVVIKLSDVYVIAVPNAETKYDDKNESLIEWNQKQKQLEKIEEAKQRSKEPSSEDKKSDDSFATKFAAQIVKNLQVFITNVHICYEDTISWPNNPFQVGITLHKLVFETQNQNNDQKNDDNIIYKLVTLEGLALYWNCNETDLLSQMEGRIIDEILSDRIANKGKTPPNLQYILWPINFASNAVINRKPESDSYKIPVIDINMDLDVFELRLTRLQFESLLLLLDAIDRMNIAQPYRKWRPFLAITGNTKNWWRFAFTAIMETDIKRRSNNWSWIKIKEHRIKMKEYQHLYKQKLLGKKVDVESLEKQLNLFSIVLARSQAEVETQQILKDKKQEPQKGWLSSWWGKDKSKTEDNIINDFKKEMTTTEKARLYEAIGYEEEIPKEFPLDFIAHKLQFTINKLFITINDANEKIAQLSLISTQLKVNHRPSSQCALVDTSVKSLYISGIAGIPLLEERTTADVLSLQFDMNPLDGQYDYGINMKMSGFKLIYDANTINCLIEMLSPPKDIQLNELQSLAAFKLQDWTQRTATGLEYAIAKHKQIKINIDIEPSFVIIPQVGQLETALNILLVSLGHINLSSKLIPKNEIPKVRDLISSHSDLDLVTKMRKMAYESYNCRIFEVQVILSDADNWQQDLESLSTIRHLLYPVELNVNIDHSIIPNDPHLAKLIIKGELPNIELKISDQQMSKLFNLLLTLPFGSDTESDDQIDGLGVNTLRTIKNIPTINSNQLMVDAINFAKETSAQIIENQTKKESEDKQEDKQIIAYKSVVFDFKLKKITVSLFEGQERDANSALANAQLIKFEIYGELLTDGSLWTSCVIGDLCLSDVRTTRSETGIKTLLEKNLQIVSESSQSSKTEKDSMFSFILTQKSDERFIEVSMTGFRLILALDYLLNLSNIITKALETNTEMSSLNKITSISPNKIIDKISEQTKIEIKKISAPKLPSQMLNIMRFNLSQVDIVLLESLEVTNTHSIIMSCHMSIDLKQKPDLIQLSGQVSQISMILTNYERYVAKHEIDAYIMKPTDLSVNGTIKGNHQMIDISLTDIRIFISPPMVNIVVNILSKLGSSAETEKSSLNKVTNVLDLFKPRTNDTKAWYLSYIPIAEEVTEDFVDLLATKKISDEQQVFLNIQSLSIVIESGGLDSQPLIKLDAYFNGKLVGYKSLSANCSLIANYYNENIFSWEPLIEPIEGKSNPWDFQIEVLLEENGKIGVKLESNEQLEITITKTSISVLTALNEAFANAVAKQLPARDDNIVILRNYLGLELSLILSESNLKTKTTSNNKTIKGKTKAITQTETLSIKPDDEVSLIATDLKVIHLHIVLKLDDENELSRRITCRGHNIRCYNLPKRSHPSNEYWKWIVEVEDVDAFTKLVTFKSNVQIVNRFNTYFDIYCAKKENHQLIGRVKPLSNLELPLDVVYDENCLLMLKPSEDYKMSDLSIDWRNAQQNESSGRLCLPLCDSSNIKPLILSCDSLKKDKNKFFVKVKFDKKDVHFEDTNATNVGSTLCHIRLIPIVKLKNLLPYNISYAIEGIDELFNVESGEESDLSYVKLGETGISLNICKYLDREWSCFKKIPSSGSENEVYFWTFTSTGHEQQLSIELAVNLSIEDSSLIVTLFAPFWMINRTSEQLIYRIDDQSLIYHAPTVLSPVLLSFNPKSFFCKKKLSLSIGDSRFSDGFSIDVIGSKGNIIAKSKNGKFHYYVSIEIQMSRIGLTKIVTITPFYSIINVSTKAIEISEDNDDWLCVKSLSNQAFWPKSAKDQVIYLRLNPDSVSSKPLSICDSSSTLIRVDGDYLYVDVDITESDATIKISDYFEGSAPVMLVNALNKPITYGQKGVTSWSSSTGEQKHINVLPPFHTILYSWYEPSGVPQLVWKYDDLINKEQTHDLKCDALLEINGIYLVSFLDAKQRILLFTNDLSLATNALQAGEITQPKINVEFIMKGIGLSIVNNDSKKDILYLAITSSVIWEIRESDNKRFKSLPSKSIDAIEGSYQKVLLNQKVGENTTIVDHQSLQLDFTDSNCPKLISPKKGQLRRLANRGIWISLAMSEHIIQCHLKINRLQIDNQMSDCMFGIVMCPISPPKTIVADQSPKSFMELSTVIERQATMNRFKYNSILIQEFLIQIDRGLLLSIQELFEVAVKKHNNKQLIAKDMKDILKNDLDVESLLSSRKSYYDFIHFSPLKVHLSFSLSGASGGQFPFGIDFFMRSAGVTLTEFNDVVFKLDYFERKNLLVADSELISIVTKHYTRQVLKQFYVLVLGLDVIGNPMKLVLGLQQGVGDFFYEPFQGIIQGPEEFAEGVSLGVRSLASNVFGGAAGALGSITGTLGEGVSVLTMDDKFRRERRSRLNRKGGFAESGKNLFRGVFAGVTGVITQPMEGAKEDGFEGLVKGVGRGVVGIVAQPTTGVIDFASGSLHALKRAIDPKQEAKQMRPSRCFSTDNKLRAYNRHYATGFTILKEMENGKYSKDNYIIHLTLTANTLIILTDKRIMSLKKGLISHSYECDWSEEWTNCDKLSKDGLKVKIITKEQKRKFGIFSGDSERVITTNSVDSSQWLLDRINKQLKRSKQ